MWIQRITSENLVRICSNVLQELYCILGVMMHHGSSHFAFLSGQFLGQFLLDGQFKLNVISDVMLLSLKSWDEDHINR